MSKAKFKVGDKVRVKKGIFKDVIGVITSMRQGTDRLIYNVKVTDICSDEFQSYYLDLVEDENEINDSTIAFRSPMCLSTSKVDNNGDLTTCDGHYVSEISLNFGIGRIAIRTDVRHWDKKVDTPYIIMQAIKVPQTIGHHVNDQTVDDRYPTIILNFINEAGLDILINMAQDIKKYFKECACK